MWSRSSIVALALIVASCTGGPVGFSPANEPPAPAPSQDASAVAADQIRAVSEAAKARPRTGIATGWGRELGSAMNYTNFIRATETPAHLSTIRYNDKDGAREMGVDFSHKTGGMQKAAGGLIEWGLSSGWGGDRELLVARRSFRCGEEE